MTRRVVYVRRSSCAGESDLTLEVVDGELVVTLEHEGVSMESHLRKGDACDLSIAIAENVGSLAR